MRRSYLYPVRPRLIIRDWDFAHAYEAGTFLRNAAESVITRRARRSCHDLKSLKVEGLKAKGIRLGSAPHHPNLS